MLLEATLGRRFEGALRRAQGQIRRRRLPVSPILGEMLQDADGRRSQRVMEAMLQMDKLDIARLREVYERE